VEHTEASGERGDHDGGRRARSEGRQQAGDEREHRQPEAERLDQDGGGGERDQDAGGLQGRAPVGQDLDGNIAAARGVDHHGERQHAAGEA
jgi:hypothetical protein